MFQIEFPTSTPQETKNSSNSLSEESTPLHKNHQIKTCEQSSRSRRNISKRKTPEPEEDGSSGSVWDNSYEEDEKSDSEYLSQRSDSNLSKKPIKRKSSVVPKSMWEKFFLSLQTFTNRNSHSDKKKRAEELFNHLERRIPKKK